MATIHIKEMSVTVADARLAKLLTSFTSAFFPAASMSVTTSAVDTPVEPTPEVAAPAQPADVDEPEVKAPAEVADKAPVASTAQYYQPMEDKELVSLVNLGLTAKSEAFKTGKNAVIFFRNALGIHYSITNAATVSSRIKDTKTTMAAVDELFLFVETYYARKWFSPGIAIGVFNVLNKMPEADKKAAVFSLKAALRHANYGVSEVPKEVNDIAKVLLEAINYKLEPNMLRYAVVARFVELKMANIFNKTIKHKATTHKLTGY